MDGDGRCHTQAYLKARYFEILIVSILLSEPISLFDSFIHRCVQGSRQPLQQRSKWVEASLVTSRVVV
jgi:hypothetical protein